MGRSALALGCALLLAVATVGCSGGDDDGKGTTTTAAPSSTVAPPPTATPSPGTGGVTVTPSAVPVAKDGTAKVQVAWTGQAPRTLMFVSVCRRPANDPTFQAGTDCAPLSELTPNGTPDGNGSIELEVFRGPVPGGDLPWGCFAAADEAPEGVQKNTTCYVRVTNDVVLNNDAAKDAPFTVVDP
ncbi:MAG: hypothetical protein ACOYOP_04655 [Microthrixaceae bacterium]